MPTDSGDAVGVLKGGAEGRFRAWTDIEVLSRDDCWRLVVSWS
jgi:hypothetical protein